MAKRIGTVTAPRLNLRRDPSMQHPPIVALPQGAEVEMLAEEGPWLRVRFAGHEGFVTAGYLSIREVEEPAVRTGRVSASALNLRAGPGTGHPVLARLRYGAPLEIVERREGWLRVVAGEAEGFVSADFVAPGDGPLPPLPGTGEALGARAELRAIPLPPALPLALAGELSGAARTAGETWNRYGGLLQMLGTTLGIPPAAAVAVLCVESGGDGFRDGRLVIRFENHVFFDHWGRGNPEVFARHFAVGAPERWKEHRFRASEAGPWTEFHGDQDAEWKVLEFARELDDEAALYSISMGAPQIMGFNHRRIGYDTAREMFDAFSADARYQILGLFDFIRVDGGLIEALRHHDFERFARAYNGTGQATLYGARIREHCDACAALLPGASPDQA